jgi:hypothetical protein
MKRYILLSCLALSAITFSARANTPANYSFYQDGKIVHPKTAMSDEDVNLILKKLQQKANDAEKLAVIKDDLKDKGIMTDQLITLLNQLNEDAKLEAAIYAFQYSVDYKKYLKIQDLFNTEVSKRRLQDYVDKHHK